MVVCKHNKFKLDGTHYPKSCHKCITCGAMRFWNKMDGWSKWQLFMPGYNQQQKKAG